MTTRQQHQIENKVNVPLTIRYWLEFLLLSFICFEAHETFHHLVGAALCGGFGTMTLSVYEPKPLCLLDPLVTLSGPFLTFAIAWFGAKLLTKNSHALFAYTLIFASFAHLRFPLPLNHSGDEWYVVSTNFEQLKHSVPAQFLMASLLFLLALPPLVVAYEAIANRHRLPIFVLSWLMPFLPLFILPIVDKWLFGADLNNVTLSLLGIPIIVLFMDLAAVGLLVFVYNPIFRQYEPINL